MYYLTKQRYFSELMTLSFQLILNELGASQCQEVLNRLISSLSEYESGDTAELQTNSFFLFDVLFDEYGYLHYSSKHIRELAEQNSPVHPSYQSTIRQRLDRYILKCLQNLISLSPDHKLDMESLAIYLQLHFAEDYI